jgi:hypothetical protein
MTFLPTPTVSWSGTAPAVPALLSLAGKDDEEAAQPPQGSSGSPSDERGAAGGSDSTRTNPAEAPRYKRGRQITSSAATKEFEVPGQPHLLMKVTRVPPGEIESYVARLKELKTKERSLSPGGGYVKLIDVRPLKEEVEEVYERAPGEQLYQMAGNEPWDTTVDRHYWESRIQQLADAPQEQFDRLVARVKEMEGLGIHVDTNKPDNFFYDSELGFTLIDVGDPRRGRTSDAVPELPTVLIAPHYVRHDSKRFPPAVRNNVQVVLDKLAKAGSRLRASEQPWFNGEMSSLFGP